MPTDRELLSIELPAITQHVPKHDADRFFMEEVLRFNSIAGTVVQSFPAGIGNSDSRSLTHILSRSLLESYFWLLYIYDDAASINHRFNELLNDFKIQYTKLYNEPQLPNKSQLEVPDPTWSSLSKPKDINSMLAALKNDHGDRLSYLYFVYRVTSFDTHGKSLKSLFDFSFSKQCNFPVLNLEKAFDLIANQYLVIWQGIR